MSAVQRCKVLPAITKCFFASDWKCCSVPWTSLATLAQTPDMVYTSQPSLARNDATFFHDCFNEKLCFSMLPDISVSISLSDCQTCQSSSSPELRQKSEMCFSNPEEKLESRIAISHHNIDSFPKYKLVSASSGSLCKSCTWMCRKVCRHLSPKSHIPYNDTMVSTGSPAGYTIQSGAPCSEPFSSPHALFRCSRHPARPFSDMRFAAYLSLDRVCHDLFR
jgi:hypothetical protein